MTAKERTRIERFLRYLGCERGLLPLLDSDILQELAVNIVSDHNTAVKEWGFR